MRNRRNAPDPEPQLTRLPDPEPEVDKYADEPYVSPSIAAALEGKQVDFGTDVRKDAPAAGDDTTDI
jgi:hypothetical protein